MSKYCNFTGWSHQYAALVYTAVKNHLANHPSLNGTALKVQFEEIRDAAEKHYYSYENSYEAANAKAQQQASATPEADKKA